MNWDEKTFGPKPKIVNLGGTIENFPKTPEVITDYKPISKKKSIQELYLEGIKKEEKKQTYQPVRSYTYDELDKMGKINHDVANNEFPYIYILSFFLLSFIVFYFRDFIKKRLIIIFSFFIHSKAKNKYLDKDGVDKSLNLKDKLAALKDLENLYSTGVINEAEFTRLKSEILN